MGFPSRVVDITEHGRHLSLDRGFLVVTEDRAVIGRVPLDDVGAVVFSAYGGSYTNPLVVALATRGAVLVTCDKRHLPVAWTLPIAGQEAQTRIIAAQVDASKPLNKRLWQYVIRAKIRACADVLEVTSKERGVLDALVPMVDSGDTKNVEATAAQRYWPALFGPGFRRDREAEGVNSLLNYGYTVLRSAVARAVIASGLHPSVSIKHRRSPLALVDDLIEPFRAVVDCRVATMARDGRTSMTRDARVDLVDVLDLGGQDGPSVVQGIEAFVRSIAKAYVDGVPPKEGGRRVAHGDVRPADDDGRAEEGGNEVQERPSGPRLRTAPVVDVHEEVPGDGGDDCP